MNRPKTANNNKCGKSIFSCLVRREREQKVLFMLDVIIVEEKDCFGFHLLYVFICVGGGAWIDVVSGVSMSEPKVIFAYKTISYALGNLI